MDGRTNSYTRYSIRKVIIIEQEGGAQWLSGRVLDSRTRGRGLELHRYTALCP